MTEVGQLRRGVLEVTAANSLVMQELGFEKERILQELQTARPDAGLKQLPLPRRQNRVTSISNRICLSQKREDAERTQRRQEKNSNRRVIESLAVISEFVPDFPRILCVSSASCVSARENKNRKQ